MFESIEGVPFSQQNVTGRLMWLRSQCDGSTTKTRSWGGKRAFKEADKALYM